MLVKEGDQMNVPIQIPSKAQNLSAILSIPEHSYCNNPIVLMCYGLNGDRADIHRIAYDAAMKFCRNGIACLRFDYRGQGVSEGEFIDTTMSSKKEDILNAINFIKGCYYNEACTIVLLGFSDGAKIVSSVVALSRDIHSIFLWNPIFQELKDGVDYTKVKRLAKVDRTNKLAMPFLGLWLGVEHLQDIKTSNSIGKFNEFVGRKVIITGLNDPYTEPIRGKQLGILDNDLIYDTVQNANHTFSSLKCADDLIDKTIWYLKKIMEKEKDE